MKIVYLCGGINGLTDEQAKGWREVAKAAFVDKVFVLDPMRRDYRGREDECVNEIVRGDLEDIRKSDALLVNAARPSWGTAMEVYHAATNSLHPGDCAPERLIVTIVPSGPVSPWLRRYSTHIVPTLEQGIELILERFKE